MLSFTLAHRIDFRRLLGEAIFGAIDERLSQRDGAGIFAAPYLAGMLLAARRVVELTGLIRGLDGLL